MEIVGAFVTSVVDALLVPVKNHVSYLVFCTKHVSKMRTKMEKLKITRLDVERDMKHNKSNSLEVPNEVEAWLKEVGTIDAQVETFPIDVGSCYNLKDQHKLGRKAFKIIQDIGRLMEEKSSINWTNNPITLAQVDSTKASTSTPSNDYNDFESRKSVYMEAFNALEADSKPHMIALCGMGGVGKTTMMEKLHKGVCEQKMFDFVIKVAIGEKMNVAEFIQTAIAEQLAIDLKEITKEARVSKLHNLFTEKSEHGKKKFLLILDDLWQSVDLKDIGLSPKPDQGIDFKVLLTSRDRKLCIQMGVEHDSILNLDVIKDSEAQDFFFQFAKISDDGDLCKIGRDITTRCHGLPIAIKTIACALYGESKHVWEDTLSKLEHKVSSEVVGEIFALSYKHLHDEETRLTLLLCGLFPEDFDTPTEDLVRYGFGLKLFRNVESIREARNRLNTCIERLIHANLLIQSQNVGCVKMHDLVRDFVLDVCSKGEYSSIVGNWPAKPMGEYCKMISLTCSGMHEFPRDLKYLKLSLLKLMHGEESLRFPEDFYEGMEQLKVIAYDEMYPLHFRSLECSSNLRTLCLHECSLLSDCSSIGNLSNLEVLSFTRSSINKLPSTMVKLNKLKLLDLTECRYLCIDDGILKSLVKLEELYMRGVRRQVNVEELVECSENLGALEIEFFDEDALPQNLSFKNLKRFRISLGCRLDKIGGQSRYSFENTLMLVTNKCELLDSGMNELFEKTNVLYLHVNGISDLGDGRGYSFHNLRVLHICECTDLRYLFTTGVANGLKQLEHLKIDKCSVLETLIDSDEICEAEVITFPALKFLSLKELPMLMSLSKGGIVIELPQLEELELESLPNITSIYQHFLKKEVMNSKLKILKINGMEKLKEIWPSQLSNNDLQLIYSQLRVIKVERCDSLVNLFPSNPMSLLHHLEAVEVRECGSIDVIFNIDLGSSSSCVVGEIEESSSSNLRSIQVRDCGELREVWRVKGVNNDLPILGFQAVEYIHIRFCKSLRNVFTPTTSNFDMKALAKISIKGPCDWEENKSNEVEEINVVAFPSYLIHTCRYLHTLEMSGFQRVEVAFEIETPNSRKLTTTLNNQQRPLLPHLKDLELGGMERMTQVWKYDRNQFLISQQEPISSSFPNLTSITLDSCNRIKYLFSPLMAKHLPNLNSITISDCDDIEEVVSNIDDEYEEIAISISSHTNTTFFPHLDILHLYGLKSLKRIDGVAANRLNSVNATFAQDKFQHSQAGVAYWSIYQYLKTINIESCDALLNVIPSHAVGGMSKLEQLRIYHCESLREIFEIEGVIIEDVVGDITDIGEGGSSDTGSAMTRIPRLTNMTNSLELPNLRALHIEGCHGLKYIFTSSTVESLKKLQELKIKDCSAIQVIVKQKDNNGLIIASSKDVMVFPRLKSLTLIRLPNLKGFFLGKDKFRWPLLDKVEMYGCPQMMIFTSGVSEAPKLKYMNTGVGKHSIECGLNFDWTNSLQHEEIQLYNSSMCSTSNIRHYLQFPWSFFSLIEVNVGFGHELRAEETIFPRIDELVKVENVGDIEEAVVDNVVFEGTNDETQSNKKPQLLMTSMDHPPTSSSCIWKINPSNLSNLTKVSLDLCHNLEHVFSYGMAASLVKLQELHISDCEDLKVIVEAVQDYSETNKAREVVSFPCLKSLSLDGCDQLEHVFSYGMAASLVKLQDLHISDCVSMKVIVEAVQDYSETNKAKEVVSFPCLKSLQLVRLYGLKGFYLGSDEAFEWPSLHTLEIRRCPEMTVFTKGQSTTPKLKVIETHYGLCEATEDLNSFIRTRIQEGYEF